MSGLLTWKEMAAQLKVEEHAFRKANWRQFPHTFVGTGRDLRSVRFVWHDNLSHLKIEGGEDVSNAIHKSREAGLPSQNQISESSVHQGWIHNQGSRQGLDGRRKTPFKNNSKSAANDPGDKTDVLRRLRGISDRQ